MIKAEGSIFQIILRKNLLNPLDFSAVFGYKLPDTGRLFRLRRYDSKAEHKNPIERQRFTDFHIHQATARYQARGFDEETYAEASNSFSDLHGALLCLFTDCGCDPPPGDTNYTFPRGAAIMGVPSLENTFLQQMGASVKLISDGPGRYRVSVPFTFNDGDVFRNCAKAGWGQMGLL